MTPRSSLILLFTSRFTTTVLSSSCSRGRYVDVRILQYAHVFRCQSPQRVASFLSSSTRRRTKKWLTAADIARYHDGTSNRMVRSVWRASFLCSLDEERRSGSRQLTLQDIMTGLVTEWFEQTDNTLEAAEAEDDDDVCNEER
jgi:hypothetical protein